MPAIYVMNTVAICVLILIQFNTPALAEDLDAELVAKRKQLTPETSEQSVKEALRLLNEFTGRVSEEDRNEKLLVFRGNLIQDILAPQQMHIEDDPRLAVFQTLAYKNPDKYVAALVDAWLPSDQFTRDTALRVAEHILDLGQSKPTVRDLQKLYDTLNHTEKPLTVFKNDRNFVLVQPSGTLELFADDTQFVVEKTTINGQSLNYLVSDDIGYGGKLSVIKDDVELDKEIVVTAKALVEHVTLRNASGTNRSVSFKFADKFSSDFKDMFEVRGWKRPKRGTMLPATRMYFPQRKVRELVLSYQPIVGEKFHTHIFVTAAGGTKFDNDTIRYGGQLKPGEKRDFTLTIYPSPFQTGSLITYSKAKALADDAFRQWRYAGAEVTVDNPDVQKILNRGWLDLFMLRQKTKGGTAIAAGTPWFACPFGRDQLITSLEMLPYRPEMTRDVLRLLAVYQGKKVDEETAEQPGKIMHELRVGEMARAKEIPFRPYYGTVDATPLWVMLLSRYYEQTGDLSLVKELQFNLQRALQFLDSETKAGNGYLTYGGKPGAALSNQGWKDSSDSVSYSSGELAKAPIALCEVQAYLYEAWSGAAKLEEALGHKAPAEALRSQASSLKERFNRDFWMQSSEPFIALGLDRDGNKIDVVSSNAGHVLLSDVLEPERARAVAERLRAEDLFTGFGIRTLSSKQKRYFPNSYHNGSVWPHDAALCVRGIQRQSPENAMKIAQGLIDAAQMQPRSRLPELFGGYDRQSIPVPVPYPVACEPQAWAAASPFMLLSSAIGYTPDAQHNRLKLMHPQLPPSIHKLQLSNLKVNSKPVSLEFIRVQDRTNMRVLQNPDKLSIEVIP